jgi:hypothetical protein
LLLPVVALVLTEAQEAAALLEGDAPGWPEKLTSYARNCLSLGIYYVALGGIVTTGRALGSGTFQKNILDGFSRKDFLVARLMQTGILTAGLVMAAGLGAVGLVIAESETLLGATERETLPGTLLGLVILFPAYGLTGLLFAVIFKDPFRAAGFFLLYRLLEKLLLALDERKWRFGVAKYLPINALDRAAEPLQLAFPDFVLLLLYLFVMAYFTFNILSKWDA